MNVNGTGILARITINGTFSHFFLFNGKNKKKMRR